MFLAACGSAQVKHQLRKDIDTSNSRILVLPLLLSDGKSVLSTKNIGFSNPLLDGVVGKVWISDLGSEAVTVMPKVAFEKIPGAYESLDLMVRSMNKAENVGENSGLKIFVDALAQTFGDRALAVTLVYPDEKAYKRSKYATVYMGLFDVKKLAWKWSARSRRGYSLIPVPYPAMVQKIISDNINHIKDANQNHLR